MKKHQHIHTFRDGDTPVTVAQNAPDSFRVTYGAQIRSGLPYVAAAHEFGECVFHSLACAGRLDKRSKQQAEIEGEPELYIPTPNDETEPTQAPEGRRPPAATVFEWLANNLGESALAPLTGTDSKAIAAFVQLVELYSYSSRPDTLGAMTLTVQNMQRKTWYLAFHAIAHVMDWSHRAQIWTAAGLPEMHNIPVCKYSPEAREVTK